MGQVFRARVVNGTSDDAGPEVAVKVLRDDLAADPDLIHRFLQEGRLLKSVDHPNVVRIRDLVAEGDRLALVMDLVDGGDLRRAVPIPCSEAQAARIVGGIAEGLAAVHAAGITHRDIKPENVLVERGPDGTGRSRLADFGVSRFESATTTRSKGMTGTVGYIAPEIARGESATAASDVYALGVILYELCAGNAPFVAEHPLALVRAHAEDPVPRPPDMSTPLWELVGSLLAKSPADRLTAEDVASRLALMTPALDGDDVAVPAGWFALEPLVAAGSPLPAEAVDGTPATAPVQVDSAGAAPATIYEVAPDAIVTDGIATDDIATGAVADDAPVTLPPAPVALPPASVFAPVSAPAGWQVPAPPSVPGGRPRRPRTALIGAVAATAVLAAGGILWAASTPALHTDNTVALGNGTGPADGGGPVLVPGATSSTEPAAGVASTSSPAKPQESSNPVAGPRAVAAVAPVAKAPRVEETRTVTRTATAPVVVVAPPQQAVRTTTATVTSTATATHTRTARAAASAPPPAEPAKPAPPAEPAPLTVALYRYWNSAIGDHFYTTDFAELGSGRSGYVYEGVQANVLPKQAPGSVPLHRYWNAATGDHFYTTNYGELGAGRSGYVYERVQAYVYPQALPGLRPIYRYWNPTTADHFYTTNFAELGTGKGGYRSEGIAGYTR
jgi:serine/threonine-protein kinase